MWCPERKSLFRRWPCGGLCLGTLVRPSAWVQDVKACGLFRSALWWIWLTAGREAGLGWEAGSASCGIPAGEVQVRPHARRHTSDCVGQLGEPPAFSGPQFPSTCRGSCRVLFTLKAGWRPTHCSGMLGGQDAGAEERMFQQRAVVLNRASSARPSGCVSPSPLLCPLQPPRGP